MKRLIIILILGIPLYLIIGTYLFYGKDSLLVGERYFNNSIPNNKITVYIPIDLLHKNINIFGSESEKLIIYKVSKLFYPIKWVIYQNKKRYYLQCGDIIKIVDESTAMNYISKYNLTDTSLEIDIWATN